MQLISFIASDNFLESKQQQSSYNRSSRNVYNSSASSHYDVTFNLVSNRSILVKDRTNFELSSSLPVNLNYRAGSKIDLDAASSMNRDDDDDYNRNQQADLIQISQSPHDHLIGQSINVSSVFPKQKNVYHNSLLLKPLLLKQYQQQQQQQRLEELQKAIEQPNELNSSFLDLFDDLWNIKNKSRITLIQLEYFVKKKKNIVNKTNGSSGKKHSNINETLTNNTTKNSPLVQLKTTNGSHETTRDNTGQSTVNNVKFGNNYKLPGKVFNHLSGANNLHGTVRNNPQRVLSSVGAQIHNWLLFIQSKLNRMISSISAPFANRQSTLQPVRLSLRQSTTTNSVVKSNDDKNLLNNNNNVGGDSQSSQKVGDKTKRLIVKRQAFVGKTKLQDMTLDSNQGEIDNNFKKVKQCVELDSNSISKCKTTEALVNVNLNNTFPGTQKSIEDNCKHIAFLLGSCWPQQLEQISASLASWNESLVSSTDFPLPSPYLKFTMNKTEHNNEPSNANSGVSCGTTPQVQDIVLDRISWMWLNLCMDKKFRQDYIDNLKCLSFWNQDRAQIVCSNEYKRMQANLAVSSEMIAKTTNPLQPNELNMLRTTTTTTNNNSDGNITRSRGDRNGDLAVIDREFESKTLCCMFDLFLRCVYKQAAKDCSNDGGQFVVSFMSRIGTDDMKYLCNGEPRTINRKLHQSNSNKKGNFTSYEKGPFIESDYCNEPRIYSALHGLKNELYQDKIPSSGKPRPLNAKNRPAIINYDPALLGGENEASESNSGSKVDLDMFYIIITWTFAFSFHFWFLFTLISE